MTTLLLDATKHDTLSADGATERLYDLVDAGTNLDPQYAQVMQTLEAPTIEQLPGTLRHGPPVPRWRYVYTLS